jgi:hypothetical protein
MSRNLVQIKAKLELWIHFTDRSVCPPSVWSCANTGTGRNATTVRTGLSDSSSATRRVTGARIQTACSPRRTNLPSRRRC